MTYRKSRYLRLSAVIHKPGPMLAMQANRTKKGKKPMRQLGGYSYQAIIPISITNEIKKSTNATTIVEAGTISRGKYTLLIRFAFPIRLFDASARPLEKNVHGNIPAKTISGYGALPSVGRFAIRPKITEKTTIVMNGRMIAQAAPI